MSFLARSGVNISHWLSQSKRRGEERRSYFTRDDVRRIAEWGMDHIRLPIDEVQMFDESGRPEPEAFDLLDQALDWSAESGLRVLVDLHILRAHYFNQPTEPALYTDESESDRFARLWDVLSAHLKHHPLDRLAYELLNEPVARNAADWNRVLRKPLAAVRHHEPERVVYLGSNRFQSATTFDELDIPDDRHLILSFHFYEPMLITHYRAGWTAIGDYDGPIHYPGQPVASEDIARLQAAVPEGRVDLKRWNAPFDADAIRHALIKPLARREETGLSLYCGEFGVRDSVQDDIRIAWLSDLIAVFHSLDIGWAVWDYRGGFGMLDLDRRPTAVYRAIQPFLERR
ncbi:MAG: cellulase family glycosylhydrolase [Phycisphaeraceae bacterium]|nr:cellulase family glycosylhydrolase [Phycisphaeraceae bacterium]